MPRFGQIIMSFLLIVLMYSPVSAVDEAPNSPSQKSPAAAWAEVPVSIAISFTSRNGSSSLAVALIELARLAKEPLFSVVLSMPASQVEANAYCLKTARRDPSGRLFDVARCAQLWPTREKAPEPKMLEEAFATSVAKQGIAAFPAVVLSTFEYQQRL